MSASDLFGGRHGERVPSTLSGRGISHAMTPTFFSSGFVFGEVSEISDVCHVLCEELFMLDGRLYIAKSMLKQSLLLYY